MDSNRWPLQFKSAAQPTELYPLGVLMSQLISISILISISVLISISILISISVLMSQSVTISISLAKFLF